jgi:hypothetical protein
VRRMIMMIIVVVMVAGGGAVRGVVRLVLHGLVYDSSVVTGRQAERGAGRRAASRRVKLPGTPPMLRAGQRHYRAEYVGCLRFIKRAQAPGFSQVARSRFFSSNSCLPISPRA